MNRTTFIDKIKLLFSEVEEQNVELAEDKPCDCKGKDCKCDEKIEEEMAEEVEVEAPEKEECKCPEGDEDCKCEEKPEEVLEPELKEEEVEVEAPEEDEMEKRLEALEKALANISESMSAIDNLSEVVSKLANSPSEGEVKLSKASGKVKKELTSRESKLKAFAKR